MQCLHTHTHTHTPCPAWPTQRMRNFLIIANFRSLGKLFPTQQAVKCFACRLKSCQFMNMLHDSRTIHIQPATRCVYAMYTQRRVCALPFNPFEPHKARVCVCECVLKRITLSRIASPRIKSLKRTAHD